MAQAALDRILETLKTDSGAPALDAPIQDTAAQLEMLAAAELAKLKKGEEAGKIADLVRTWYTQADSARLEEKKQWYKNLDMYQGRHFTSWSTAFGQMRELPNANIEPRIAVNVCEPIARTEMAKTGSNHPTASVAPASNDQADIMAALAGEQAWDWFYRKTKFQTVVFSPANFWRTITGNGFIKTFFNHAAIDHAASEAAESDYKKLVAQYEQMGLTAAEAGPEPEPVYGKIDAQYVSPFHLLVPDQTELDIQKQAYVLHTYNLPFEQAKLAYKDFVPKDWNPSLVSSNTIMHVAYLGIKGSNAAVVDSVQVIEAWVRPGITSLLPDGGLVVTVGDELVALSRDGLPYEHEELPFAHLTGIETGRFYRKSVIESITPLQNELNRVYAQIITAKNLAVKPQFFFDEGSVDPRRITSRAGLYIPIRLGMNRPSPVPISDLPSYVMNLIDQIKSHLDDISGQHQVSRATSPGADTAASALALLIETDDNFLSTTFDSIEAAVETVARQTLALMVQFWDLPRLVKITGEESGFDARMLMGSDLENGTDISIDKGSGLPKSKAARIATITEWIDKGIIPPDAGLEAMEMGTLGKIYQRIKLDKDAARRENVEMKNLNPEDLASHYAQQEEAIGMAMQDLQGQAAGSGIDAASMVEQPQPALAYPIGWMDNHAVHAEEHRAFAKSQEYRNLPPEVQQEIQKHTEAHDAEVAAAAEQQAMMGQPAGAPDGAPAPDGYAGPDAQPAA